ncbi:hypothetical protein BGX27_006692 [Mortierella sp. AM989]|nr:hypothetical protein BGX27_006692 [Mortierella sp. AM989]
MDSGYDPYLADAASMRAALEFPNERTEFRVAEHEVGGAPFQIQSPMKITKADVEDANTPNVMNDVKLNHLDHRIQLYFQAVINQYKFCPASLNEGIDTFITGPGSHSNHQDSRFDHPRNRASSPELNLGDLF